MTLFDLPTHKYDSSVDRLNDVNFLLQSGRDSSCIPWVVPWILATMGCHFYPISKFILKNRMVPFGNK